MLLGAGVELDVGAGVELGVGAGVELDVGAGVELGVTVIVGVGVGVIQHDSKQYVPGNDTQELGILDGVADRESEYATWQLSKCIALILKVKALLSGDKFIQVPSPRIICLVDI